MWIWLYYCRKHRKQETCAQLTIIIMEQRIEWDRKGPEHPDVLYLNNESFKIYEQGIFR